MDPKRHKEALNADAITEILRRLPAKSVCRFRCVSRLWLSLLSDPLFLRAHSAAAPAETYGFYAYDTRQAEFFSLNGGRGGYPDPTLSFLDYRGTPPEPVDACNGLLLCRLPRKFKSEPFVLSVSNPKTREHEVIPLPPDIRRDIMKASLRLAFDPRRSPHYMILALVVAFGIDHQLMYKYASKYTSETRSWNLIDDGSIGLTDDASYWRMRSSPSVYWNGLFVCLSHGFNTLGFNALAALDMEGEKVRDLSLPPPQETKGFSLLAASGERLHYIRGQTYIQFEIWEMTSESSGWHVLHHVDLDSIKHLFDPSHYIRLVRVVAFIRGDEDQLLLRMPYNIISYNIQQKILTTISPPSIFHYEIFPLAHSLFPLTLNMVYASPSHEWVSWKSEHDQLLINMMVEHSRNGKKIKNGFRIDAWREMARMFNQATGLNYDVRHLENRFKSYKREYQTVKKIVAMDGFRWAPSEKVVKASDADWHKRFKSKPKALVYKRKQVLFEDLKIICASSVRIDNEV